MTWTIGVDVGGTFTDFYALNEDTGQVCVSKRPSTPDNPANAILLGLEQLSEEHSIALEDVTRLGHGTTVGTNALIQRRGASIAVVTTEGFGDLLEIGRQTRPHMFDMFMDHPPPLAPAERRFEVVERITGDGTVLKALDADSVARIVQQVADSGADACAVCCLFSFISSEHEEAIGEALAKALPGVHLSLSSHVQPEFREFERFSTTAINAYLQPIMNTYVQRLEDGLKSRMPGITVGINQSSGGLMAPERARALPVRTALSGPAAGAVGAVFVARESGYENVITLDMGGTSADVALIRDSGFELAFDRDVAGFPIRLPMVDIETVGAGGGSVAWFDRDGLLKAGPLSAGADPGPACYGRGGTDPTVSDANLVLGRLSAGGLLGGTMSLDTALARESIEPLAQSMELGVERTAQGIVSVVVANMVRAIRTISVERGHDPRRFALMPFGGAGPLHARDVANALGIDTIIVPLAPGIVCAQGLVVSDLKEDFVRGARMQIDDSTMPALREEIAGLRKDADGWFRSIGAIGSQQRYALRLDMRYVGQNFELAVPLGDDGRMPDVDDIDTPMLKERFFAVHERSYGYFNPEDAVEIVNARLTASAVLREVSAKESGQAAASAADAPASGARDVWFDGDSAHSARVYQRDDLKPGNVIEGPAVIDQLDTTTLVYPEDTARVDDTGNIHISLASRRV